MMITFLKRTFSSVVLLTLFFSSIFWTPYRDKIFGLLVVFLSYFAVREFTTILKNSGHPANNKVTPVMTSITAIVVFMGWYTCAVICAALFVAHNWLLFLTSRNEDGKMQSILNSVAAYTLFTVPIALLVYIYQLSSGQPYAYILLYLIIVTKISDIGAYVTGTVFHAVSGGKNHKMVPSISPGKSYEGAVGGIACAIAASFIMWPWCGFSVNAWWMPLSAGVVLFFGSVAGDLSESVFKRVCKVKDSGNFLPGIGGIFDLVDSMLINSVIFFIFIKAVVKLPL